MAISPADKPRYLFLTILDEPQPTPESHGYATSGWNAAYTPTSGTVAARNVSYNATIAPGASVGIGFQATHTGNTAKPTSFTLNGATCATA